MAIVPTEPKPGDIVLDTDVTVSTLIDYDAFKWDYPDLLSVVDVLGLFALAEAIVLNERVLSEHISDDGATRFETVSSLIGSGILHPIDRVTEYREPDEFQKAAWASLEPFADQVRGAWPGADFTLSASVRRAEWCDEHNVDHLPWPIFGALPGTLSGGRRSPLQQTYGHLSAVVGTRVETVRGAGSPIPMYIPPIPAVVLERCSGKATRFIPEAIALREEFADSRRKIAKYQSVLSEGERSLGELSQAYSDSVSDVVRELDRLKLKRTDSKLVLEMWEAVGETKLGEQGMNPDVQISLNLGALLSKGLKWFAVRRVKARARLLFDLYEKTLQIRNYGGLINDVFKVDQSRFSREMLLMGRIGATVDRLVKADRSSGWGHRLPLAPQHQRFSNSSLVPSRRRGGWR
jgi:hypothetical protein